jgi:hypothetical protein
MVASNVHTIKYTYTNVEIDTQKNKKHVHNIFQKRNRNLKVI